MTIHYAFIDNPFNDFYLGPDEITFLRRTLSLSELKFIDIWQTAFTKIGYAGSPLFYAWTGTLQKILDTEPFYSLLFQKLNVAFLGSFIPGVVYLLCNRITDKRNAFKAAVIYGMFSMTFFFSVGLLRDVHIALIYSITFLILTGDKYGLKNYAILISLGIMAYFMRIENGLFFLAFIGVWMIKSGGNNKLLLFLATVAGLIGTVVFLGGVEAIYKTAMNTVLYYSERSARLADQDSFAVQLMQMPIPINWISVTAFGQIKPFPFWVEFKDGLSFFKNIFYLPKAIAGLFWFAVWMRIIRFPNRVKEFFGKYKYISITVILYLIIVSVAMTLPRRLMAVYPMLFMAYIYISNKIFKIKELFIDILGYSILVIIYLILKM